MTKKPEAMPLSSIFAGDMHRLKFELSLPTMDQKLKSAIEDARWWAMDANGQAHWLLVPNVAPHTDFWYSDQVPAPSFGYSGNWKESLTERPTA